MGWQDDAFALHAWAVASGQACMPVLPMTSPVIRLGSGDQEGLADMLALQVCYWYWTSGEPPLPPSNPLLTAVGCAGHGLAQCHGALLLWIQVPGSSLDLESLPQSLLCLPQPLPPVFTPSLCSPSLPT